MKTILNSLNLIYFSKGIDNFDNTPLQITANSFDEFKESILRDRSPRKGTTYFCGPLSFGSHDRPSDFPNDANYRLATHALPRKFLAIDQDGCLDKDIYEEYVNCLSIFKGFGYTTWGHTADKPRSRAVFELNREVDRAEGIALGKAFDRMIKFAFGDNALQLDKSVYQNEQPVYSPGPNAQIFYFEGKPLDVDEFLTKYPEPAKKFNAPNASEVSQFVKNGPTGYSRLTLGSLYKVLGFIDCTNEPDWHDVSNILARIYGEEGRELFIRYSLGEFWGQPYVKFNTNEVNRKYDRSLHELKSRPNGFGIKYLIELAGLMYEDVEFENSNQIQMLVNNTSFNTNLVGVIEFKALGKNNKPLQVSENLSTVLNTFGITARYNQISKRGEFLVPGLQCVVDESNNTALTKVTDLAIKSGMTANRVPEMLDALASENPYCPVRQFIDFKPWDGVDRFNEFTAQIQYNNVTFATLLIRKWLIQAVAAAYEDQGIANAGVLVLTASQGMGKTRLFKDLTAGIPGVFLEGQTLNPADKDSVMSASSHWVVELGELDATFRKADIAQLKAFITKSTDTLRRPYARRDSIFPRRTVFAGTVNDFLFLHDPSGNRRFWPIAVDSITRDESIDYQQLWAQVKTWYANKESWYLDSNELNLLNQYSETFMVSDPDVESLLSRFPFVGCTIWKRMKMNDICAQIDLFKPTKGQQMRLAEAIRKYNGGQKPYQSSGVKLHVVPDLSPPKLQTTVSVSSNPVPPVAPVAL